MDPKSQTIGTQVVKKNKKIAYSPWDSWDAREYLKTYFSKLGQDSYENLKFIVRELKKLQPNPKRKILDFGAGPTIFAGVAAAPYAGTIHLCDYLESNLIEIKKWLSSNEDSFDWSYCIKHILELEGLESHEFAIQERADVFKKKAESVFRSDASLEWPIFSEMHEKYPVVISNFCADSATSSKEVWRAYMKNIFNTVEDEGVLLITALRNCKFYKSGESIFPSANVNEEDLENILIENGFSKKNLLIEVKSVPACADEGFTTIMCVSATKLTKKEREIVKIFQELPKK